MFMCPQTANLVITPFDCCYTINGVEEEGGSGGEGKLKLLPLTALHNVMCDRSVQTSPILPASCRQYISRLKSKLVVLEFAPTIVDASYLGLEIWNFESQSAPPAHITMVDIAKRSYPMATFKVPTPWMQYIALLGCEEGLNFIRHDYATASAHPLKSSGDILSLCPFGNVHGVDSTVCWGSFSSDNNSFRNIDFLENLFLPRFFGSPFNKDLDNSSKWNARYAQEHLGHSSGGASSYELLKVLNGRDVFPKELLSPMRKDYKSFIADIVNRYLR